jgi:hypothetical protein
MLGDARISNLEPLPAIFCCPNSQFPNDEESRRSLSNIGGRELTRSYVASRRTTVAIHSAMDKTLEIISRSNRHELRTPQDLEET